MKEFRSEAKTEPPEKKQTTASSRQQPPPYSQQKRRLTTHGRSWREWISEIWASSAPTQQLGWPPGEVLQAASVPVPQPGCYNLPKTDSSSVGSEISIQEGQAETKAGKSEFGFISGEFYQSFQQDFPFPPSDCFLRTDARREVRKRKRPTEGRRRGDEETSRGRIRTSVSSCGSRGLTHQQVSINGLR